MIYLEKVCRLLERISEQRMETLVISLLVIVYNKYMFCKISSIKRSTCPHVHIGYQFRFTAVRFYLKKSSGSNVYLYSERVDVAVALACSGQLV